MKLSSAQIDRACGALLGTAVGDALGAGYEFGSAPLGQDGPAMIGGGLGNFAPGEWTDDTTMMWCIADVASQGPDLRTEEGLTAVARNFCEWYETGPRDVGMQTAQILRRVGWSPSAGSMTKAAQMLHQREGRSGGNGSLMRTAPVALPYLGDPDAVVEVARRVSALTHYEDDAQDACVLWSLAIRHAILHGEFDVRSGLDYLSAAQAVRWGRLIDEAEELDPGIFTPNGWVVTAFQAAWSSIVHTPVPEVDPSRHYADSLVTAINVGNDTDTVAAIAGALLGARWGASAIPGAWRRVSHGYPGIGGERLVELATLAANGGPIVYNWPLEPKISYRGFGAAGTCVPHPHDDGVLIGDALALECLPAEVDAVVSLCLIGQEQVPEGRESIVFRLIDRPQPHENPNLDFVLVDAAATIRQLRHEGKKVFVHCVAAQSRTPTVAIAYAMTLGASLEEARRAVLRVLPSARPNDGFNAALERLAP